MNKREEIIHTKSKNSAKKHLVVSAKEQQRWYELRREKTGLRGFRPGLTQIRLRSVRKWLEAWNFVFRKERDCTIRVAKTKALISFVVTARLICVLFSHMQNPVFSRRGSYRSHFMRNPALCIGGNKGADQLHGISSADQCLCFATYSTIQLLSKSEISTLYQSSVVV